ncbi:hypothetical protein [Pseudomonas sp. HLT2-19-2]
MLILETGLPSLAEARFMSPRGDYWDRLQGADFSTNGSAPLFEFRVNSIESNVVWIAIFASKLHGIGYTCNTLIRTDVELLTGVTA